VEEEPAGRRGGIDLVGQALEVDLPALQFGHKVHQALHATTQAIQFPYHEGISLPEMGHGLQQPWPISPGPAHLVLEDSAASSSLEGVQLQGQVLVFGADPGVADSHGEPSRNPSPGSPVERGQSRKGFEKDFAPGFGWKWGGLGPAQKPSYGSKAWGGDPRHCADGILGTVLAEELGDLTHREPLLAPGADSLHFVAAHQVSHGLGDGRQVGGCARHFMDGVAKFYGGRLVVADLLAHPPKMLFGIQAGLGLGSGGILDAPDHLSDLGHAGGDPLQRTHCCVHGVSALVDGRTHLLDQLMDLMSGLGAAVGQLAHLLRHYGEALAGFAGLSGFDGGVE